MNEHVKDCIIKIGFMWILLGAAFTLPASCCKAVNAFYKQVIQKPSTEVVEPTVIVK